MPAISRLKRPEAEPPPPPDDTPPPDPTADTTPSPDSTPPSDTPPAEDPGKGQKTVDDYLGDGKQGPEGPAPDLPTGRSVRYTLDKAGNRTSVTDNVNGNATYAPNNLNQYTSVDGSSVINGPEHEIQRYNNVRYYYVNDEHLKRVTSGSNAYDLFYDALGRCVKRIINGSTTYYIYDGEKPILEYRSTDLSNPAKNVYGKGIDEILMRYDPSFTQNQTFYYQQDHEGSVTHLLNTSGNVIETYKYDAFGAPAILRTGWYHPAQRFHRQQPFPVYRKRIRGPVRLLRIPRKSISSNAGPIHERRPEAVRCRRLQSLPLLP